VVLPLVEADAPPAPVVVAVPVVVTAEVVEAELVAAVTVTVTVLVVLPAWVPAALCMPVAFCALDAELPVVVAVLVEEIVAPLEAVESWVPESELSPAASSFPEQARMVIADAVARHKH